MANTTLQMLDDFALENFDEQNELTFKNKTQFEVYEINTRYFVIITSYIEQIQPDGRSGIVAIIRDMTNEHNMDQMKKTLLRMYHMNYARLYLYCKGIQNPSLMVSSPNLQKFMSHFQLC